LRSGLFRLIFGLMVSTCNLVRQLRGPAFEDVAVMKKPIEHGGDGPALSPSSFAPVLDRSVGGHPACWRDRNGA